MYWNADDDESRLDIYMNNIRISFLKSFEIQVVF